MPEGETAEAPEKRRRAQRKLTEADRETLREICQWPEAKNAKGEIDCAAVAMLSGCSYGQVYNFIRADRYLHAQVAEASLDKVVPKDTDLIDGNQALPPGVVAITKENFAEYQKLVRQNQRMLARDWEKLGLTEEEGAMMEHYATLGTAPTGQIMRVTTGQLISNLTLLDQVIKNDAEMIIHGRLPEEFDGNGDPRDPEAVERDWRYALYAGMQLQMKIFEQVHRTQALMARVMKDLQGMGAGREPQRGTFSMEQRNASNQS
jgi:hypothetical protein